MDMEDLLPDEDYSQAGIHRAQLYRLHVVYNAVFHNMLIRSLSDYNKGDLTLEERKVMDKGYGAMEELAKVFYRIYCHTVPQEVKELEVVKGLEKRIRILLRLK